MKLTVFQHVPHEHPGLIAKYVKDKGIELNIVELWKPYVMPDLNDADAFIIMGGSMGVYEDFPSKYDELTFIKSAIDKIPIIGFCLGSQLLAHALGAKVYPNEQDGKRVKEIGYYDVELTEVGLRDPLFRDFSTPMKVLQWHGDAFDLPQGARLLATSRDCTNQAFRYGDRTYGLLFHNEFTPEMVAKQIKVDNKWIHENFALDEEALKRQARDNADLMQRQCQQLMDNVVSLI